MSRVNWGDASPSPQRAGTGLAPTGNLDDFLSPGQIVVRQRKEWVEIVVDWETTNRYEVLAASGESLGMVAERPGGMFSALKRGFFRSHRAMEVDLVNRAGQSLAHYSRPFFFLFSELSVRGSEGATLGQVRRRFGIIYKKYDLVDASGRVFATIRSPRWRLWTFPIYDAHDNEAGSISKKWGGALREVFTDADTYLVDYGSRNWTTPQKAVILAAAVSIDFDFFENNQGSSGVLDMLSD